MVVLGMSEDLATDVGTGLGQFSIMRHAVVSARPITSGHRRCAKTPRGWRPVLGMDHSTVSVYEKPDGRVPDLAYFDGFLAEVASRTDVTADVRKDNRDSSGRLLRLLCDRPQERGRTNSCRQMLRVYERTLEREALIAELTDVRQQQVLREMFDLDYEEIAEAVHKPPATVRQIAHRARAHVAARRPRGSVTPAEARDALDASRRAVETGDLQRLVDSLAPDAVLLGHGGGVVQAVPSPVARRPSCRGGLFGRRSCQVRRRGVAAVGTGQWPPGTDSLTQRRDQHCPGGAHRRRPCHRALRRAQS
ncbi:hypothetical protein ACE1SV_75630 [Streptomyces sennicomposti]